MSNNKWWINWQLNNDKEGWSYSEKTTMCPEQTDPFWTNCSGDGMKFRCLDDNDDDDDDWTPTTAVPPTPQPPSLCRNNHLYDKNFGPYDSSSVQNTYEPGYTMDITCLKYTNPTWNRVSHICPYMSHN